MCVWEGCACARACVQCPEVFYLDLQILKVNNFFLHGSHRSTK